MITEDSVSDQPNKKPQDAGNADGHIDNKTAYGVDAASGQAEDSPETGTNPAEVAVSSRLVEQERDKTEATGHSEYSDSSENGETESSAPQTDEEPASDDQVLNSETENTATQTIDAEEDHVAEEPDEISNLNLNEILDEMQNIVSKDDAGAEFKKFNQLKDQAHKLIHDESEDEKKIFKEKEDESAEFSFTHPEQGRFSALTNQFREKNNAFTRKQDEQHAANLVERQDIIEKLKALYTNTEAGTNLFKAIREIKDAWKNAGQVAKSEFKILNNNYFHHLNQFYQMLDMNKEYLEQEFAHNLEKRQHIIERAKQLQKEPAVQKALNELQYLHKLWKEEAEPVAEEFREKTWEMFKEISNKIHDRKSELSAQIETEQNENLEKKNKIIEELKKLAKPEKEPNHSYWQNAIKKIEDLRSEFLKIGSVPRKISNQNWNEFKVQLKNFNSAKNDFYKSLKTSQHTNLEKKLQLIQTAKDNSLSEDWETAVPLFKKLQEDWKQIGHVPRSMTNKVWDDFRDACNTFFNNYREKNNATNDNWKENYKRKKQLLDELKEITDEEGSVEKIEQIKTTWNNTGKVPREKLSINTEFNKVLREKMKLNKIHEYDLKEEGLSENQLTDKARKIKNQITDLEAEIVKMENNLGFFSNPTRENPLLKETFEKIDDKKVQLESMKQSLHNILAGENQ